MHSRRTHPHTSPRSSLAATTDRILTILLSFALFSTPLTIRAQESSDNGAVIEASDASVPADPETADETSLADTVDPAATNVEDPSDASNQPGDGQDAQGEADQEIAVQPADPSEATEDSEGTLPSGGADEPAATPDPSEEQVPQAAPSASSVKGTVILRSSLASALVVDKAGGIRQDRGAGNAQLYTSNGSLAQQLTVTYDDQGLATIAISDGSVLEVSGGTAAKGSDVRFWRSNGTIAQKWRLVDNANGTVTVFSALDTTLCLDVQGGKAANGANLQLWTSNGSTAQRFVAVPFAGMAPESNVDLNGKIVEIHSALGGNLTLDVASGSTASGASVQLWTRNGSLAQAWRLESQGDGYYALRPTHSRMALAAPYGAVLPSTKVQQQTIPTAGPISSQKWSLQQQADGTYCILAASSGLALDVTGGTAAKGTSTQLWRSNGSAAQRWEIKVISDVSASDAVALEPGTYRIESAQTTSALSTPALVADVASGSVNNGANIRLWSSNSSVAQQFRVRVGTDGKTITFIGTSSLKALDVASASPWPLANVQLYRSNNSAAQQWLAFANDDGTYSFRSVSSGLALDASSSSKGANLRTNLPSSSAAQRFRLVKVVDNRSLVALLNAHEVNSIRIIGDSISDGFGLPGYTTAARGTAIAYDNGYTVRYESPLSLPTYANSLRSFAKSHGVSSFVVAGLSGWKMSQLASNPNAWLQGGADVVIVALGINDARDGNSIELFQANAEKALAAAAGTCKLLIVMTEPCGTATATPMAQVDAVLRDICTRNGYLHVSMLNSLYSTNTYYSGDRIHPTQAGQSLLWWSLSQQLCL